MTTSQQPRQRTLGGAGRGSRTPTTPTTDPKTAGYSEPADIVEPWSLWIAEQTGKSGNTVAQENIEANSDESKRAWVHKELELRSPQGLREEGLDVGR
jgi:hypothetical protein